VVPVNVSAGCHWQVGQIYYFKQRDTGPRDQKRQVEGLRCLATQQRTVKVSLPVTGLPAPSAESLAPSARVKS